MQNNESRMIGKRIRWHKFELEGEGVIIERILIERNGTHITGYLIESDNHEIEAIPADEITKCAWESENK